MKVGLKNRASIYVLVVITGCPTAAYVYFHLRRQGIAVGKRFLGTRAQALLVSRFMGAPLALSVIVWRR